MDVYDDACVRVATGLKMSDVEESFANQLLLGGGSKNVTLEKHLQGDEDPLRVASTVGTVMLLCMLALAMVAGIVAVWQARSRYREYVMGATSKEEDSGAASAAAAEDVITLYTALPGKAEEKGCARCFSIEEEEDGDDEEKRRKGVPVFTAVE